MERLTRRLNNNKIVAIKGDSCNYSANSFDCQLSEGRKRLKTALEKLADYEDLEEQGLLVRLPCKVGDSVFIIVGKDVSKQKIIKVEISDNGIIFKTNRQKRIFSIAGLGENVFLTLEEAEKKLEEMQNAKNA
jgi:hypothetical protein